MNTNYSPSINGLLDKREHSEFIEDKTTRNNLSDQNALTNVGNAQLDAAFNLINKLETVEQNISPGFVVSWDDLCQACEKDGIQYNQIESDFIKLLDKKRFHLVERQQLNDRNVLKLISNLIIEFQDEKLNKKLLHKFKIFVSSPFRVCFMKKNVAANFNDQTEIIDLKIAHSYYKDIFHDIIRAMQKKDFISKDEVRDITSSYEINQLSQKILLKCLSCSKKFQKFRCGHKRYLGRLDCNRDKLKKQAIAFSLEDSLKELESSISSVVEKVEDCEKKAKEFASSNNKLDSIKCLKQKKVLLNESNFLLRKISTFECSLLELQNIQDSETFSKFQPKIKNQIKKIKTNNDQLENNLSDQVDPTVSMVDDFLVNKTELEKEYQHLLNTKDVQEADRSFGAVEKNGLNHLCENENNDMKFFDAESEIPFEKDADVQCLMYQ